MADGNPELHQPLVVQLDSRHQSGVGKRVNRIKLGVAEDVVIGRKLRFDTGHRDEAAHSHIHAVSNLRNVDIQIFERGIKAILMMIVQQLAAEVALRYVKR